MVASNQYELSDALDTLQEGESALYGPAPNEEHMALYPLDINKLNEVVNDQKYVFSFCMVFRPGNALFQRYLELKYFHPNGPDNELLLCIFHKWQGMLWSITGVPRKWKDGDIIYDGESYMREAIDYAKLRIVKSGFVPMMIGGEGKPNAEFQGVPTHAPLFDMSNVFYLENQSDHLMYTDQKAAEEEQARMIQELEEQYL